MFRVLGLAVALGLMGCASRTLGDTSGDGGDATDGDDGQPTPPGPPPPGDPPQPDPPPEPPPDTGDGATSDEPDDVPPDEPPPQPPVESGPWCADLDPNDPPGLDMEPPRVRIVEPPDGEVFVAPAEFDLVGEATDDVCLSAVDLYVDDTLVLTFDVGPLEGVVMAAPVGVYEFWLVAHDDAGNRTTSNVVTVTVE